MRVRVAQKSHRPGQRALARRCPIGTGSQSSFTARVAGFLLALFATVALPGFAASVQGEAIRFDLDVLPAAKRYVELAAYPSYLAVALQNNGFSPSQSGRIIIEDGHTLSFRNAVVAFVRQDKSVFHYLATVEWSIGVAQSRERYRQENKQESVGIK